MKTYKKTFDALKQGNEGALVGFTVIGDPDYSASLRIAKAIVDAGADVLELGLPFSDPIADGSVIQEADVRALDKGMTTDKVFRFIRELRKHTDVPIGLLTYFNLVYQRGAGAFYGDCKKSGVNSVLIADMPLEEYGPMAKAARKHGIQTALTVTQLTTDIRMKEITKHATGFVYLVSRLGVTGARADLQASTLHLIRRARKFTRKPLCVGFGISTPAHVRAVMRAGADGAIVGSAIVELVGKNLGDRKRMLSRISSFVKRMKAATRGK